MAFGIDDAVAGATKLIDDAINKIWPDPSQKATAEALTIKATSDAAIAQMAQQMSVMLAEANSADKWTSRARPSFLYVMYAMILWSLPMGIVYAINPVLAGHIADGMQASLAAIPESLWTLMTTGYLGYVGAREIGKAGGVVPLFKGKK
jgi:hypothetical protein